MKMHSFLLLEVQIQPEEVGRAGLLEVLEQCLLIALSLAWVSDLGGHFLSVLYPSLCFSVTLCSLPSPFSRP